MILLAIGLFAIVAGTSVSAMIIEYGLLLTLVSLLISGAVGTSALSLTTCILWMWGQYEIRRDASLIQLVSVRTADPWSIDRYDS